MPERALAIRQLAPRFLKALQRMLGLMASASSVLQLGLLQKYVPALLKKPSVSETKEFPLGSLNKTQNSFCISENRGYVNNRVRF